MKLCAIYNVWDDWDMLENSILNIQKSVDGVVIVDSKKSNYGEEITSCRYAFSGVVTVVMREPQFDNPMQSETDKRNFGLQKARELGYTHFITMDADEFYHPEDVERAKKMFEEDTELKGVVVSSQVYFKSPTLTIGLDTTRVPFIHKITPDLKHEFNRKYPFAWEGGRDIKIDPTRSLNINDGVKFVPQIVMHHYSWIRQDYKKKIRNSTAKSNLERSTILQDLMQAKEGYYCNFYGKVLHRVPNYFNIPEYDVMV